VRDLLASGHLIDIALAVIALEIVFLVARARRVPQGLKPLDVMGQILAGAFLMLAVRSAVTGADYRLTLAFLTASFPAHLFDLARRVRRRA